MRVVVIPSPSPQPSPASGRGGKNYSMRKRARGFPPRVDAALEMARRSDSGLVRRLHRHRGALAEGAVEQDLFACGFGELVEDSPRAEVFLQGGVGHVERTGYHAVSL